MQTQIDHETTVTIQVTKIKLINEINDEVYSVSVNGKLNTTESKNHAKEIGYTFVSKENIKESFDVNTNELLQLRK